LNKGKSRNQSIGAIDAFTEVGDLRKGKLAKIPLR